MSLLPVVLEDGFTNPDGQFQPSVLICGLSVNISKAFCSAASVRPGCIFSAYNCQQRKALANHLLCKGLCSFGLSVPSAGKAGM